MKFTTEQQKEIAQYAIEHDNDYKATGEKNGISYQQVAAWVRKYKTELESSDKKVEPSNKKVQPVKETSSKKVSTKAAIEESDQSDEPDDSASTLDVLSRRDPVLEKQLEDVKRRLGLIK